MEYANSDALNERMAARQNGETLLAFSCGKDSIAAWLNLRRFFKRIIPVHMYLIPGLEFVETGLQYYEDWFDTRIIRLPHPSLYRMINELTFQSPENCHLVERAGLPSFDYNDVFRVVREDYRLAPEMYHATGVRAKDSPMRWIGIQTHGPVDHSGMKFHCIYDWDKARMLSEIENAGIKLPVDYQMFGRSFDGIDYRFLAPIRERFPDDYQRILAFFPLAELELRRIEYRRTYADDSVDQDPDGLIEETSISED